MDFLSLAWAPQSSAGDPALRCLLLRDATGPPQSGAPPGEPTFDGALQEAFRTEPNALETKPDLSSEPRIRLELPSSGQTWFAHGLAEAAWVIPPAALPTFDGSLEAGLTSDPEQAFKPWVQGQVPAAGLLALKSPGLFGPPAAQIPVSPELTPFGSLGEQEGVSHKWLARTPVLGVATNASGDPLAVPLAAKKASVFAQLPVFMSVEAAPAQRIEASASPSVALSLPDSTGAPVVRAEAAHPAVLQLTSGGSGESLKPVPMPSIMFQPPAENLQPVPMPSITFQPPGEGLRPVPMPSITFQPPIPGGQGGSPLPPAEGLAPVPMPSIALDRPGQPMALQGPALPAGVVASEAETALPSVQVPVGSAAVVATLAPQVAAEVLGDGLAKKGLRGVKSGTLEATTPGVEQLANTAIVSEKGIPIEAPATRLELPPAVQSEVLRRVQETLNELLEARRGRSITIRLHPEELGEVVLKVNTFGTRVDTEVRSNNEHVRQAIVEHRAELVRTVESKGLSLGSLSVGHHEGSHSGRQEQHIPMRQEFERIGRLSLDTNPASGQPTPTRHDNLNVDYRI